MINYKVAKDLMFCMLKKYAGDLGLTATLEADCVVLTSTNQLKLSEFKSLMNHPDLKDVTTELRYSVYYNSGGEIENIRLMIPPEQPFSSTSSTTVDTKATSNEKSVILPGESLDEKIKQLADRFGFKLLPTNPNDTYWMLKADTISLLINSLRAHNIEFSFNKNLVKIFKDNIALESNIQKILTTAILPTPPQVVETLTSGSTEGSKIMLHSNLDRIDDLALLLDMNVEITINGNLKIYEPKQTDFQKNFNFRVLKAYLKVYPNIVYCGFDGYLFVTVDGPENPSDLMSLVWMDPELIISAPSKHYAQIDALVDLLTQKSINHGIIEKNGINTITIKMTH